MFRIELDIYSGRPNPSWVLDEAEGSELVERLRAEPRMMGAVNDVTLGLGYRGYIVTALSEGGSWQRAGLPSQFRVIGKGGIDIDASASWLLGTREVEIGEPTERIAQGAIEGHAKEPPPEVQPMAAPTCPIMQLTSDTDFSFWNNGSVQPFNNCYNFAANYRTDTFAQPGRRGGYTLPPASQLTCSNTMTGVTRDNWSTTCGLGPLRNLVICLVVAPGADFHFYRLCANGHWCHKPGSTPARNTDNSGNWITDPQFANRGPYTSLCGYRMGLVGTGTGNGFVVA